jgi:hypothetical protein
LYVYKVIAVKELFEYPEFYMKDFGYNIFYPSNGTPKPTGPVAADSTVFHTIELAVHANQPNVSNPAGQAQFIAAAIKGKYKGFSDRDLVAIELKENFELRGSFRAKGSILQGTGWIIDDKVFIDLGYPGHAVVVYDKDGNGGKAGNQGIPLAALRNNEPVLLKVSPLNADR